MQSIHGQEGAIHSCRVRPWLHWPAPFTHTQLPTLHSLPGTHPPSPLSSPPLTPPTNILTSLPAPLPAPPPAPPQAGSGNRTILRGVVTRLSGSTGFQLINVTNAPIILQGRTWGGLLVNRVGGGRRRRDAGCGRGRGGREGRGRVSGAFGGGERGEGRQGEGMQGMQRRERGCLILQPEMATLATLSHCPHKP